MVVSPGIPHARIGASLVLFYHYMKAIKEWGVRTRNHLLIQKENINEEHLLQYMQEFHDQSQFEVVPLNFDTPIIESNYLRIIINPENHASVTERINDYNPDVLICIDFTSAWLAAEANCRDKIVWLGDLNFQTIWYHEIYSLREQKNNVFKAVKRLVRIARVCRKWKSIYSHVLSKMNLIIVSSKSSENALRKLGIHSKYLPYPWPNHSTHPGKGVLPEKPTFLFYGTLKALGSRSSFHFMLRELYPKLKSLWGRDGFKIRIAGRGGLYPWVEKELSDKSEFEYLGFVEELDSLMKSCHAILAPIDIPVGNRSRILTAMANRTLVIAHKNTSLTNPELSDGQTCLLAGNVEEFCDRMRYAYQQPDEIGQIVDRAHDMYMRLFHPDSAKKLFINHIAQHVRANNGVN
jgi:hypothetical protein